MVDFSNKTSTKWFIKVLSLHIASHHDRDGHMYQVKEVLHVHVYIYIYMGVCRQEVPLLKFLRTC